jgi:hypothetical protein
MTLDDTFQPTVLLLSLSLLDTTTGLTLAGSKPCFCVVCGETLVDLYCNARLIWTCCHKEVERY